MQRLYGNFMPFEESIKEAIEKYENALRFKKCRSKSVLNKEKSSQCCFQTSDYKNTIRVLEDYKAVAEKDIKSSSIK